MSSRTVKASRVSSKLADLIALIPGYDPLATAGDCVFDEVEARRSVDFFAECIKHTDGDESTVGKPFVLEPWQAAINANLFGWKRPDGTRRYREAYCQLSRGNGKSTWGAGLVAYGLVGLGAYGAQIYCAAGTRDQAGFVFRPAKAMVEAEPWFAEIGVRTVNNAILWESRGNFVKALAADGNTNHGANIQLAVVDELHIVDWDFWRVLRTACGKRRDPLLICTTTAGWDRESVCHQRYTYACQVRDGIVSDIGMLPVIYEIDPVADDWKDESTWRKANPNYGISVQPDYLRKMCAEAIQLPSEENTFRQLHLGQWTEQAKRWLPMDHWQQCTGEVDAEALAGKECFAGLDLSSTTDMTALVLLFPGKDDEPYKAICEFWIPEAKATLREKRDRVPFGTWIRDGHVRTTPGDTIDYAFLRKRIREVSQIYELRQIAYDPWNATQIAQELQDSDGLSMVQFRQGYASMSEPSKYLEKIVVSHELHHGNNPVLNWMASNVTVQTDPNGNIRPVKPEHGTSLRIDGIVALVMALGLAIVTPEAEIPVGLIEI